VKELQITYKCGDVSLARHMVTIAKPGEAVAWTKFQSCIASMYDVIEENAVGMN
jgi:hypothetical protein